MFQIIIHATGSSGNAYSIIDGANHLLIDPGIRFKDLQQKLEFKVSEVQLALISHEHNDHCRAVADLVKIGIPCAASKGTWHAMGIDQALILENEKVFNFGPWQVLPFDVHHDAAEPLCFLIMSPSEKKICYITDTRYVDFRFKGVTHYMVECNYSEELLDKNPQLMEDVKLRIRQNHFELGMVKEFFASQDLSKTESIHLLHLSNDNSDEKLFISEIERITGKPVFTQ